MTTTVDTVPMNKNLKALWSNHFHVGVNMMVFEGGSRSGKTFSIMEYLLNIGLGDEKLRIGCFRADQTTCKDSVIKDAQEILGTKYIGGDPSGDFLGTRWKYLKSELRMVSDTGSEIKFGGTTDSGKLHGPQWDMIFINECTEVSYKSFTQLQQRTRSLIILDFNPSVTQHWVFSRVISQGPEKCFYVHSTYRDNVYLDKEQVSRIEAYEPTEENRQKGTADPWRWDVYGLGKRGKIEGAVYTNWGIRYDGWPDQFACKFFGYGLDYGFTDPTVLLSCGLHNGNVYVKQLVYQGELSAVISKTNPSGASLEKIMNDMNLNKRDPYIADSASPERNNQLRGAGYNIIDAHKPQGSIVEGIALLRSHYIYVHPESIDVIRELQHYRFPADGHGIHRGKPEDKDNHAMDALRYWALHFLSKGRGTSNDIGGRSWPKTQSSSKRRI